MKTLIPDFIRSVSISGKSIAESQLQMLPRGCPHVPSALPREKMAVYVFAHGETVLKVGKVGPNSNARFQSQHYSPANSRSNLAKSLLDDENSPCRDISVENIGSWMRDNLTRTDFLFRAECSEFLRGISSVPLLAEI